MPPEDDSRPADRRSRAGGVRPIGDVLAELLNQYGLGPLDTSVVVVEQTPAAK
jgi:hypothetical protein